MNILVTGANGQLGSHIKLLGEKSSHHYIFTDVDELDITRRGEVLNYVLHQNINAIVNCAAYTNVDRAEEEEELADRVNNVAVRNLADAMKVNNGFLLQISTDYVFGGTGYNTPCREDVKPNPTGAYGRTKMLGEQAIAEVGCRSIIIRTGWLYSEYGVNFCKTMLRLTSERDRLNVVFDQVGTPTYAGDLAKVVFDIMESESFRGNEGIYHYSNEGVCSWFDFAVEIAELAGNANCLISPCHSDEFPSKVIRPSFSVLDKSKIKATFDITIPHWKRSLRLCLENMKQNTQD